MNKVYFSSVDFKEEWGSGYKDNGQFLIILFPRQWWSIKAWKLCIDFQKSFQSRFVEDSQ